MGLELIIIKSIKYTLLTLFFINTVVAKDNQIKVIADNVTINEITNISHYSGNVGFFYTNISITADEVYITKRSKKEKDYEIVATSKEAVIYKQGINITAKANKITYFFINKMLQLEGNASIYRNNDNFSGDKISYNINQNKVKINSDTGIRAKIKINL